MEKKNSIRKFVQLDKPHFFLADPNNPVTYTTRPGHASEQVSQHLKKAALSAADALGSMSGATVSAGEMNQMKKLIPSPDVVVVNGDPYDMTADVEEAEKNLDDMYDRQDRMNAAKWLGKKPEAIGSLTPEELNAYHMENEAQEIQDRLNEDDEMDDDTRIALIKRLRELR